MLENLTNVVRMFGDVVRVWKWTDCAAVMVSPVESTLLRNDGTR